MASPLPPHGTSIPPESNQTFPVIASHRFSTLPPYTIIDDSEQPAASSSIDPTQDQVHDASVIPKVPSETLHQYTPSRPRDYALITVTSHAQNAQDPPLLYFGEELKGSVVLPSGGLSDMRSIDVVLQMFDSDPITPSYEAKCILLSHDVNDSHVSGGQFRWPFALSSPVSSSSASSAGSDRRFQLIVTIYRRGWLKRNIGVRQKISYVLPPDPSKESSPGSPPPYPAEFPHNPPAVSSWPRQSYPAVFVSGVMFGQVPVRVECKLVSPTSYAASDTIPLRLTLISEKREALDVFSVSKIIDVRLQKILFFGEQAAAVGPLNLMNPNSLYRSDLAASARARWQPDGRARELLPDEEHPRLRWSIELDGNLHRETGIELNPSFDEPGMALVYFVSLFALHSKEFRSAGNPDKPLVMGKIQLTAPNGSTS